MCAKCELLDSKSAIVHKIEVAHFSLHTKLVYIIANHIHDNTHVQL